MLGMRDVGSGVWIYLVWIYLVPFSISLLGSSGPSGQNIDKRQRTARGIQLGLLLFLLP